MDGSILGFFICGNTFLYEARFLSLILILMLKNNDIF